LWWNLAHCQSNSVKAIAFLAGSPDKSGNWYLDSGATHHMCNDVNLLSNLKPQQTEVVGSVKESNAQCNSAGEAFIQCNELIKLKDVLFVPDLNRNLISIKKMDEAGLKAVFGEGDYFRR
jgi:hypothetical protein